MPWSSLISITNNGSQKLWNAYWENKYTQKIRIWADRSFPRQLVFYHGLYYTYILHKSIVKFAAILSAIVCLAVPIIFLIQLFFLLGIIGKIVAIVCWLILLATSFLLGLHLWIADQIKRLVEREQLLDWFSKALAFISINLVGAAIISIAAISIGPSVNFFSNSGISFGDTINIICSSESVKKEKHAITQRPEPVQKNDSISCSAPKPSNPASKNPPLKNTSRLVGSTNIPVSWKVGSASQIFAGMSNTKVDWHELGFTENLCDIKNLFVIGTASGDGEKVDNERLAMERANHIALNVRRILEHCTGTPEVKIVRVNLGESQSVLSDGWNRRVIAFSSTASYSENFRFDEVRNVVSESVSEIFFLKISDYSAFKICASTWPEFDCDWVSQ